MVIQKIKNILIYTTIINTLITAFLFYGYIQIALNNYDDNLYNQINYLGLPALILIVMLCIEWSNILVASKHTKPIHQFLTNFIQKHYQTIQQYEKPAQNAFLKYATRRAITSVCYYGCMNISFLIAYYYIFITETSLLMTVLVFFIAIIVLSFIYNLILTYVLNKNYYFCYVEMPNVSMIYLFMTYYLLQVQTNDQILFSDYELINISAVLSRNMYFEEGYHFVQLWKNHIKKLSPLYQFLYIEHCLCHLTMLKRSDDVQLAYQDYLATKQKYPRYKNNKNVKKMDYLVSLYYAFNQADWKKIIELEKSYSHYFKDYKDNDIYIFYCAYQHCQSEKAQELLLKYPTHPFFQKGSDL